MQKKKGISLIVLAITILVMAILAATAIIALEDTGVIKRSKNTVTKQNYSEELTRLEVIKNGVLTDNLGTITVSEYVQELTNKGLIEGSATTNSDGSMTVTTTTGFTATISQDGTSNLKIVLEGDGITNNQTASGGNTSTGGDNADTTTPTTSTFSTEYASVEVVWLTTSNTVSTSPNAPVIGSLTPVKWSGTTESTTTTSDTAWYSYVAATGTTDSKSSKWANAKDSSGNYFVWIPRYAYRIIYYADAAKTTISGYSDGRGIVDANGNVQYALDSGAQTVTYNGNKYIVHPAFETNIELGGWSSDISGFWMGKYETDYDTMDILPNVDSSSCTTIGAMYTMSQNYMSSMNSHMMKNSEWGAVAYLTWSAYGRNGNQLDINTSFTTGYSAGSASAESTATTYAYTTTEGQEASSTGNIYGIYDLAGGCVEYVAAFNNTDDNDWESQYGSSFAGTSNSSTIYATKYYNSTSTSAGTEIYSVGKTGDATKEVFSGTAPYSINGDFSRYVCSTNPFFIRGGGTNNKDGAGIFYLHNAYSGWANGGATDRSSRVILCE